MGWFVFWHEFGCVSVSFGMAVFREKSVTLSDTKEYQGFAQKVA